MSDAPATVMPIRTLMSSALSLAERGWHVFPCVPGGKRPALRGSWQDHATIEPVRIGAWWSRAAYNIGIACGPSGLVVIDLDVPHNIGEISCNEGRTTVSGADVLADPAAGADDVAAVAAHVDVRAEPPGGVPHR